MSHSKTEACAKCLRKHTSEILARNTCWYEAHIEELSQKVGALKKERDELRAKLDVAQAHIEEANKTNVENAELRAKLAELEESNAVAADQLQYMKKNFLHAADERNALRVNLAIATEALREIFKKRKPHTYYVERMYELRKSVANIADAALAKINGGNNEPSQG